MSDRVRFLGERHDVPALLQAADIYCQPNVNPEPFGISLVEAQGAGLPIVTSSFGGALEIVDEHCGLLVAPHDIDALAAALRRLLADASLRARLGQAARDRADALCDLTRQMQQASRRALERCLTKLGNRCHRAHARWSPHSDHRRRACHPACLASVLPRSATACRFRD